MAKNWDEMDVTEQLAWARAKLREIAETAESEKVQSMAAGALARSLEQSVVKAQPSPTQPQSGAAESEEYLRAVELEVKEKLERLRKQRS